MEVLVADHLGFDQATQADLASSIVLPGSPSPMPVTLGSDFVHEVLLRGLDVAWPRCRRRPLPGVGTGDGVCALRDGLGEPSLVERLGASLAAALDADGLARLGDVLGPGGVDGWAARFPGLHRQRFRGLPIIWSILGEDGRPLAIANAHLLSDTRSRAHLVRLVRRSDGADATSRLDVLDNWHPDWSRGLRTAAAPLVANGLVAPA